MESKALALEMHMESKALALEKARIYGVQSFSFGVERAFMESKALALEMSTHGVQSFSFGNERAWSPKL
jgi:hypothetical protein